MILTAAYSINDANQFTPMRMRSKRSKVSQMVKLVEPPMIDDEKEIHDGGLSSFTMVDHKNHTDLTSASKRDVSGNYS